MASARARFGASLALAVSATLLPAVAASAAPTTTGMPSAAATARTAAPTAVTAPASVVLPRVGATGRVALSAAVLGAYGKNGPPPELQKFYRDSAYKYILNTLDDANTSLLAGGTAFPFTLHSGFAGFNTPANFSFFLDLPSVTDAAGFRRTASLTPFKVSE